MKKDEGLRLFILFQFVTGTFFKTKFILIIVVLCLRLSTLSERIKTQSSMSFCRGFHEVK